MDKPSAPAFTELNDLASEQVGSRAFVPRHIPILNYILCKIKQIIVLFNVIQYNINCNVDANKNDILVFDFALF